jgi:hypothetical protein
MMSQTRIPAMAAPPMIQATATPAMVVDPNLPPEELDAAVVLAAVVFAVIALAAVVFAAVVFAAVVFAAVVFAAVVFAAVVFAAVVFKAGAAIVIVEVLVSVEISGLVDNDTKAAP